MIYRVKLDCGYREFYFDFTNADHATEFMTNAATAYNKKQSDKMEIVLEVYTMDEYNALGKEEEKKND